MSGRYLTFDEATTALGRGETVEQFLGGGRSSEGATIRRIEVSKDATGRFVTRFVVSLDLQNEPGAPDVYAFPPADAELPNGESRTFAFEADALDYAVSSLGAAPGRFVAHGKLPEEYADYRQSAKR